MAGSITVTASDIGNGYTKYSLAWTSDASGNVNSIPVPIRRGRLLQVKYVPGSGGSQPSSNYGVTIADADGVDVLNGTGASKSNSAASVVVPFWGDGTTKSQLLFLESGNLTPSITGGGNAKSGRIDLIVGP